MSTQTSWVLRDALLQLEAVVYIKRDIEIEEKRGEKPEGVLNRDDVRLAQDLLQGWLVEFTSPLELTEACEKLVALVNDTKSAERDEKYPLLPAPRALAPGLRDETISFLILETLYKILSNIATLPPGPYQRSISVITSPDKVPQPPEAIQSLSESLAAAATCPWRRYSTDEGGCYYYNDSTGESSWEEPNEWSYLQAQAQAQADAQAEAQAQYRAFTASQASLEDTKTVASSTSQEKVHPLAGVPAVIIQLCLNFLSPRYSVATRHAASSCLSVLSQCFLDEIVMSFIGKLTDLKKNKLDLADAINYQRAAGYLDFGLTTHEQFETTVRYLNQLSESMGKMEHPDLCKELCESLSAIFNRIYKPKDKNTWQNWDTFLKREGRGSDKLQIEFEKVYANVAKWVGNKALTISAMTLSLHMVCTSRDARWYCSAKRGDILKLTVRGLKRDQFRETCVELIRDYFRDIDEAMIKKDLEVFTEQLALVMSSLFVKGKTPKLTEAQLMGEILVEAGRRHMHYVINDFAPEVLKGRNQYTMLQKAIVWRALGILASENVEEIAKYNYNLGPLLTQYIEDPRYRREKERECKEIDLILLRAALTCFPFIRPLKPERVQMTATTIGQITLFNDSITSSTATQSLVDFVRLNPRRHLVFTLYIYVDLLREIRFPRMDCLQKIVRDVNAIMNFIATQIKIQNIDPDDFLPVKEWIAVRQHFEGVFCIWMCHPEAWVRRLILEMLQLFSLPEIKQLESKESEPIYLVDRFQTVGNTEDKLTKSPTLFNVIKNEHKTFAGIITWAWSQMHNHVGHFIQEARSNFVPTSMNTVTQTVDTMVVVAGVGVVVPMPIEDGSASSNPSLPHLMSTMSLETLETESCRNKLLFLCLTAQPADPSAPRNRGYQPYRITKLPPRSPSFSGSLTPASPDRESKGEIYEERVRLDNHQCKMSEVDLFFFDVVCLLYEEKPNMAVLHQSVVESLLQIPPICYVEMTLQLRTPLDSFLAKKETKSLAPQVLLRKKCSIFYLHKHQLQIFARLFNTMSPSSYHREVNEITAQLEDFIQHFLQIPNSMWEEHTILTRLHVTSLFTSYVGFRNCPLTMHNKQHASKASLLAKRSSFFSLLTSHHFLPLTAGAGIDYTDNQTLGGGSVSTSSPPPTRSRAPTLSISSPPPSIPTESGQDPVNITTLVLRVLKVVESFVALGSFSQQDPKLEKLVLGFLHHIVLLLTLSVAVSQQASNTFKVFLATNPHRLTHFIAMSFPESHGCSDEEWNEEGTSASGEVAALGITFEQEVESSWREKDVRTLSASTPLTDPLLLATGRPLSIETLKIDAANRLAMYYFQAVALNFIENLEEWVFTQGVHHATVFLFSILHQVSPKQEKRMMALRVAEALAQPLDNAPDESQFYKYRPTSTPTTSADEPSIMSPLATPEKVRPFRLPITPDNEDDHASRLEEGTTPSSTARKLPLSMALDRGQLTVVSQPAALSASSSDTNPLTSLQVKKRAPSLHLFSHHSPLIYTQQAYNYSRGVARQERYRTLLPALVQQGSVFITYLNTTNRKHLVKTLVPWMSEFAPLIYETSEKSTIADSILASLCTISSHCARNKSMDLSILVGDLWLSLLTHRQYAECASPLVTTFFIQHYQKSVLLPDDTIRIPEESGSKHKDHETITSAQSAEVDPTRPTSQSTFSLRFFFADVEGGYCTNCGLKTRTRCGSCQIVYYCGNTCQVGHWPFHQTFCQFNNPSFTPTVSTKKTQKKGAGDEGMDSDDESSGLDRKHKVRGTSQRERKVRFSSAMENEGSTQISISLSTPSTPSRPQESESKNTQPQPQAQPPTPPKFTMGVPGSYTAGGDNVTVLTSSFLYLTRSNSGDMVANSMVQHLRHYPTPQQLSQEGGSGTDFDVSTMLQRKVTEEATTAKEQSAFRLLVHFVADAGRFVETHIPILLQNTCALFEKSDDGVQMLNYISFFLLNKGVFPLGINGSSIIPFSDPQPEQTTFFCALAATRPDLAKKLRALAVHWAYYTYDPKIRASSFEVLYNVENAFLSAPNLLEHKQGQDLITDSTLNTLAAIGLWCVFEALKIEDSIKETVQIISLDEQKRRSFDVPNKNLKNSNNGDTSLEKQADAYRRMIGKKRNVIETLLKPVPHTIPPNYLQHLIQMLQNESLCQEWRTRRSTWGALLTLGGSLLSHYKVNNFQMGLSFFHHMIGTVNKKLKKKKVSRKPELKSSTSEDVKKSSEEDPKLWALALGNYFEIKSSEPSDSKESEMEVTRVISQTLLKGFSHPITAERTLYVLYLLANQYDHLPLYNPLVILMLLGTILLRTVDAITFLTKFAPIKPRVVSTVPSFIPAFGVNMMGTPGKSNLDPVVALDSILNTAMKQGGRSETETKQPEEDEDALQKAVLTAVTGIHHAIAVITLVLNVADKERNEEKKVSLQIIASTCGRMAYSVWSSLSAYTSRSSRQPIASADLKALSLDINRLSHRFEKLGLHINPRLKKKEIRSSSLSNPKASSSSFTSPVSSASSFLSPTQSFMSRSRGLSTTVGSPMSTNSLSFPKTMSSVGRGSSNSMMSPSFLGIQPGYKFPSPKSMLGGIKTYSSEEPTVNSLTGRVSSSGEGDFVEGFLGLGVFFKHFNSLFNEQIWYDKVLVVLVTLLKETSLTLHSSHPWRIVLLSMLGCFLHTSQHKPNHVQLPMLTEVLVCSAHSRETLIRQAANAITFSLVRQATTEDHPSYRHMFNFLRPRLQELSKELVVPTPDTLMISDKQVHKDASKECLERFKLHCLPRIKDMLQRISYQPIPAVEPTVIAPRPHELLSPASMYPPPPPPPNVDDSGPLVWLGTSVIPQSPLPNSATPFMAVASPFLQPPPPPPSPPPSPPASPARLDVHLASRSHFLPSQLAGRSPSHRQISSIFFTAPPTSPKASSSSPLSISSTTSSTQSTIASILGSSPSASSTVITETIETQTSSTVLIGTPIVGAAGLAAPGSEQLISLSNTTVPLSTSFSSSSSSLTVLSSLSSSSLSSSSSSDSSSSSSSSVLSSSTIEPSLVSSPSRSALADISSTSNLLPLSSSLIPITSKSPIQKKTVSSPTKKRISSPTKQNRSPRKQRSPSKWQQISPSKDKENKRPGKSPPKKPSPDKSLWKAAKDKNGRVYYYNRLTRQTTWKIPTSATEPIPTKKVPGDSDQVTKTESV